MKYVWPFLHSISHFFKAQLLLGRRDLFEVQLASYYTDSIPFILFLLKKILSRTDNILYVLCISVFNINVITAIHPSMTKDYNYIIIFSSLLVFVLPHLHSAHFSPPNSVSTARDLSSLYRYAYCSIRLQVVDLMSRKWHLIAGNKCVRFVCIQMCDTAWLLTKLYSNYPCGCATVAINSHQKSGL